MTGVDASTTRVEWSVFERCKGHAARFLRCALRRAWRHAKDTFDDNEQRLRTCACKRALRRSVFLPQGLGRR